MNNFEFISYQETPNDKYGMLAIITVRLYGKIILRYKKMIAKTGGEFFSSPSFTIENNGEKKYINTHMLDSRAEDELLMEFIREKCHEYEHKKSAHRIQETNSKTFRPTDTTTYQSENKPEQKDIFQDNIPF